MIFKYLQEPQHGQYRPSRDAFKYLERGMKAVGWMSPEKGSSNYRIYLPWSVIGISAVAIYLPIGFFASYLIDFGSFTPADFLTSIQVAFNSCGLSMKIAVLVPNMWRFQKAKNLLDTMDPGQQQCGQRQQELNQVHRGVVLCNSVYVLYQTLYGSYTILTFSRTMVTGSTPWGLYNPFVDYRENVRSLWIAATIEYFIGSLAVLANQVADLVPVIFGLVLRTHLKLLTERIQRLRSDDDESDLMNYEELVNCVKYHKLILQYCNIFRPIISGTIFAQFLVIGLGLGLSLLNLLFFSTNLWTGIATIVCIVVLMFETFPFCYLCEIIGDDCYKLTSAIAHSNWIDANKRYKSTLVYFLHQAQQTINFNAGGVFPISMKTNIEVAKLAFSVITICKQMNIIEQIKIKLTN